MTFYIYTVQMVCTITEKNKKQKYFSGAVLGIFFLPVLQILLIMCLVIKSISVEFISKN